MRCAAAGWALTCACIVDNNHVYNNRLSTIMQELVDGGCIYTLGPQPNSRCVACTAPGFSKYPDVDCCFR